MYRLTLLISAVFLAAMPLMAQDVNIGSLDPNDIDLSKVDISDAEFYFNGPVEIFVDGVKYGGKTYVAELDYDGGTTVEVKAPDVLSTGMRPQSVDLSDARIRMARDGVILENVIVEGVRYAGKVVPGEGNNLRIASYEVEGEAGGAEERLAEYRSEIREKERKIQELQGKLGEMKKEEAPAEETYPRSMVRGLVRPEESFGSWTVSGGMLKQTDGASRYAKYLARQNQSPDKLKYSFSGRAVGRGWRGFGLHFLASGIDDVDGYGLGESYLVWVTRDESAMQTDATYVQLYKSLSDVRMIEVKSTITDFNIAWDMDIEVHVDKMKGSITVVANDEEMFTFEDESFISSGNTLAVRALGEVEFENFSLKSD